MIRTKKFLTLAIILASAFTVIAQKVTVTKDAERVKGTSVDGFSTEMNAPFDEVTASFSKYLKSFAKTKLTGSITQLSETQIGSSKYTSPIYATTHYTGDKTVAWIGLNPAEWPSSEEAEKAMKELEKVVYDFGVKFYRDVIQRDVDEAVRAQTAAEKQQLKLQADNKNLNARLEFNQKEKVRLEKALADNKAEYEMLLKSIEKNKKDQDSVVVATEQIKKMVDVHKERQKKVN